MRSKNTIIKKNSKSGKIDFFKRLIAYYKEFLETDFRKQNTPKRSIKLRLDGYSMGFNLEKYKAFQEEVRKYLLDQDCDFASLTININRNKYNLEPPPQLKRSILDEVDKISQDQVETTVSDITSKLRKLCAEMSGHADYLKEANKIINEKISNSWIVPFSQILKKNNADEHTIFKLENNLREVLYVDIQSKNMLVTAVKFSNGEYKKFEAMLRKQFSLSALKKKLHRFFEKFSYGDLFSEFVKLIETKELNEKSEFYLYFCDISFRNDNYPLFYFPLRISRDKGDVITISFEPRCFINKSAISFILQENEQKRKKIAGSVDERIIYLDKDNKGSFMKRLQDVVSDLSDYFSLDEIDILENCTVRRKSLSVNMSNSIHVCLFDKSDESIVNDYEELQSILNSESDNKLISFLCDFINKDPVSLDTAIKDDWDKESASSHLVYDFPIPLNEEQHKILRAIRRKDCDYIVVQGPPGTGKSHTIAAIAFDAVINDHSVLVLSDKKEALDVVEYKITSTLDKIEHSENFLNPILRLDNPNFTRLVKTTSINKIRDYYDAMKSQMEQTNSYLERQKSSLSSEIEKLVECYKDFSLDELSEFIELENSIEEKCSVIEIDESSVSSYLPALKSFFENVKQMCNDDEYMFFIDWLSESYGCLCDADTKQSVENFKILCNLFDGKNKRKYFTSLFENNELGLAKKLSERLSDIMFSGCVLERLFNKLIKRKEIEKLKTELTEILNLPATMDFYLEFASLYESINSILEIKEQIKSRNISKKEVCDFRKFLHSSADYNKEEMLKKIACFENVLKRNIADIPQSVLSKLKIDLSLSKMKNEKDIGTILEAIKQISCYLDKRKKYTSMFALSDIHYAPRLEEIAKTGATKMAFLMAKRFSKFMETHKNTVKALKNLIKKKVKFPQSEFEEIKKAFPCIIAGIRDYAEYIPLEEEIFDLIVIDEASQVSVAQAFPAVLRAKKILVLGDNQQFSNVKTAMASNAVNAGYISELTALFKSNISTDAVYLERMGKFNIKTSILDFLEHVSNYNAMLRKHFRGYRELISYSNKYFYESRLQIVKIRAKPVDETLKFSQIECDEEKLSGKKNINPFEAEFIMKEIKRIFSENQPITVGIITPFTDQQKFIMNKFHLLENKAEIFEKLKLKIMTFDSCQGEERDVIFFSMVASFVSDKLNNVFPAKLDFVCDEEGKIREQRLNVGFSRAKECMHFVLSKQIDSFGGAIGEVLRFYKNEVEIAKKLPTEKDVDPSSPMEGKVLSWIYDASFYQKNREKFSIQPQFPIGEYLKQMDSNYKHPKYRCDFLVSYRNENRSVMIIIEYDGFKEHFTNLDEINQFNYESYYKESDIERQKILESYGCHFIRLNKFNLGQNPADTISQKLKKTIEEALHLRNC